jgi:DNA-binding CsgD family transcriptional regulator
VEIAGDTPMFQLGSKHTQLESSEHGRLDPAQLGSAGIVRPERERAAMYSSMHHTTDQDLTRWWHAGMQALEVLGIGWLLCDAEGRVMSADPIASRILKARDGLRLNSDGVPCATRGCSERVAEAVQRAARASWMEGQQEDHRAALIVRRAPGQRALALLVRPIRAQGTSENSQPSAAVVLILDSSLSVQATTAELRQLCGFTPAEAELANLLMKGFSLHDCSGQLGVLRATAAARLRRMFRKTGVRRQSELVSVLLKTIGLVRLRSEKARLLTRMSEELLEQAVNRAPGSPSTPHIVHVVSATHQ